MRCSCSMKRTSNARLLRIAIVASLAFHAAFAAVVHPSSVVDAQEQRPARTEILHIRMTPPPRPRITPTPPPPHRVERATRPAVRHVKRPAVHLIVQHARPAKGAVTVAVQPAETGNPQPLESPGAGPVATALPSPAVTPTPKPACSSPDVAAKAIDTVSPGTPEGVDAVHAVAQIEVQLDAAGNVLNAGVYSSTGYPQLDRAALEAARESRYAPEQRDCKNVAGSYLFTVDFTQ